MILVFNSGSSSIKISLFNKEEKIASVHFKNYSQDEYNVSLNDNESIAILKEDYKNSYRKTLELLIESSYISSEEDIELIVHRIVRGGEKFSKPTILNNETISEIEAFNDFAPLHNPPALNIVKKYIY